MSYYSIFKNLDELGFERFNERERSMSDLKIAEIERNYKIKFPTFYKEIILNYNSTCPTEEFEFPTLENSSWYSKKNYTDFLCLLSVEDNNFNITEYIEMYLGRLPECLIPIAVSHGGNLICLGISENAMDKVFFWDHENESECESWGNIYLIANSTLEFFSSFKKNKTEYSRKDLSEIILNPSQKFLDRIEKSKKTKDSPSLREN